MNDTTLSHYKKPDADYVDLRSLLRCIVEKRWFIVIFTCIIVSLAVLYTVFKPIKYQASILLRVQHNQYGLISPTGGVGQPTSSANLVEEPFALQIPLIKTEYILRPVMQTLGLDGDMLNTLRGNLTITDLNTQAENSANKVAVARISFSYKDPIMVTKILNEIVNAMKKQNIKLKSIDAENKLNFLLQQLPILKRSLQNAQAKLNSYLSTSGRIDNNLQTQYLLTHLAEIDKELEKKRIKKIALLQQYTMHHPSLISLKQEQIELTNKRSELLKQLKQLPDIDQVNDSLKQEVKVKNNLYMLLLNDIHQYQVIKTGIISDIEVLSPVTPPEMVKRPRLLVIVIFSALIGLMLGSVISILGKLLRRRVDDPIWTELTWNIKTLTTIPYSKIQHTNSLLMKSSNTIPLLTQQNPNDMAIEALCQLRTLLQIKSHENGNNVIALLGITKGAGKTFIAANLASLLARIGNKVLLIDADIRNGHLHRYFTTVSTPGLTDIINGQTTIEKALVHCKNFTNLDFLSAGNLTERPADLLMGSQFKDLIGELKSRYQFIILNTPPSITSFDNILIGMLANMNVLIIGANKHRADEINAAIRNFNDAGIELDGCIFNRLKVKKKYNWKRPIKNIKKPLFNFYS